MRIVPLVVVMTKANFSLAQIDKMVRDGVASYVWRAGRICVRLPY